MTVSRKGYDEWEKFVQTVKTLDSAVGNILDEFFLLDWHFTGSYLNIQLGRAVKPFAKTYFDEPERLSKLTNYCMNYWHKSSEDLRIQFFDLKQVPENLKATE